MKELFVPFGRTSKIQMQIAAVVIALLVVGIWSLKLHPLFPTPAEVFTQLGYQIESKGLLFELFQSFKLNLEALLLSTTIAALLAYGQVIPVIRIVVTAMENFRFISAGVLMFTFGIFVKDPHMVKVYVVCFAMFPFILTGLANAVRTIDEGSFHHARTMKLGHMSTTWQVVILGKRDQLIEVVRQNYSIGWYMTPVVEGFVRSEGGVGLMLIEQSKYLKLADMFAILLAIFIVGLMQNMFLLYAAKTICPYASIKKGVFE